MGEALLLIGGSIFVMLGGFHGLLTIRDLFDPRTFTPTDSRVREAMRGARLALNPRTNLWKAWLGFNLSHSLGLVIFGGTAVYVAQHNFELFVHAIFVQLAMVGCAAIYFGLSLFFWFWGPALASGVALLCFLVATIVQ